MLRYLKLKIKSVNWLFTMQLRFLNQITDTFSGTCGYQASMAKTAIFGTLW